MKQAENINEVVLFLDDIIDYAIKEKSRLGYFPSLYKKVTQNVKDQLETGYFDRPELMEKLDVVFANRYINAFEIYQSLGKPTKVWWLAFQATKKWRPTVLQHLLLGMNAHIGLDLAISAVESVPAEQLPAFESDFKKINELLSSQIDTVQNQLAHIWPMLKVFDLVAGEFDEYLARFGLEKTRDFAWNTALELSVLSEAEKQIRIKELDDKIYNWGKIILKPGTGLTLLLLLVRLGEMRFVKNIIKTLNRNFSA